ncbi:hypothetical protein Q1695_006179 [Nippostrongylus brasiliensis]|nr:hypothetical protein Q1695_006179 [Nippostrongylus brasiliensis]
MSLSDHIGTIIELEAQGKPLTEIHKRLSQDGCTASYYALRRFFARIKSRGSETDNPRSSLEPIGAVIREVITNSYMADSSMSSKLVNNRLKQMGIDVSDRHVRRIRKELGFKTRTVKYCQLIRDANKIRRVEFCSEMLAANETFSDCVFTDECCIQVEANTRQCFTRDQDQASRLRSRPKHPAKIHVWGGISTRGTTDLVLFAGRVRLYSKMYCQILEKSYLKFMKKKYNGFSRLVQDNAPPHTSSVTAQWMREKGVRTLDWPPESPDLNPIELVWGNMKQHIRKQKVTNVEELKKAAKTYWRGLTPEMCCKYVSGIRWRMEKIIEAGGGNIVERKP